MIAEIASIARTAPAMIPNAFSPFLAFCLFSLVITFVPNSSSLVVTETLSSTSSSREISNSSASKTSLSRSGVESPSSHLDTVWRVTSSRLASSSWKAPFLFSSHRAYFQIPYSFLLGLECQHSICISRISPPIPPCNLATEINISEKSWGLA